MFKMRWLKPVFVFAIVLNTKMLLYAQVDTSGSTLAEVTVTATREADSSMNQPYATTVLQQKSIIEQLPRSLPEALAGMPGVFVQKTNHGGGSPFIRGLTGNQILTIIDGIRLNNSTFRYGPNQYLNTIDLFTVDKVEVLRGSGSVQYGSDALGGVIQVFTKEPRFSSKPALHGEVLGKMMTGGMERTLRGELGFSTQKFALYGGTSFKKFGDLWGGDTTRKQTPSGYDERDFDVKLKMTLPRQWQLKAAHQTLIQHDVPVYHKIKLENYALNKMDPQIRRLSYLNFEKFFSTRYFNKLLIIFSNQQTSETRLNQKNGSSIRNKEKDDVNTKGLTADLNHWFNKYWSANTGLEYYFDKVNSIKTETNTATGSLKNLRGLYPNHSTYHNLSLYSMHHFTLNHWVFEGGARYNSFIIGVYDSSLGDVNIHPSAVVANAGILRKINRFNSVYINYSRGFRAPNIDDVGTLGIVDFRYELPAYALRPETSNNIEIGYKLAATRVYSNIALFYNQLKNLISRQKIEGQVINGYPVYQKFNNERAYIWGTDVDLGLAITERLDALVTTSYTFGQNTTKDEPLRRIPPNNKRVLIHYHREKWFTKAEFLTAKKQDRLAKADTEDNRIPIGGTPGWKVFNVYGGYSFKNIMLNAGLQNILNEDYRTHGSGINGVGRSAWVAFQWKF